ncbi:Molybdopterin adenylyltransferase [subsurface metagenome]
MKVAVITISDRASRGGYKDLSGLDIEGLIRQSFADAEITKEIVSDEREEILAAFTQCSGADYILTIGGTGISLRDITPEVTEEYCDRTLAGIAEILRAESYKETKNAMLSRGYACLKWNTIIVNFTGSVKAVRLCTKT